MSGLAHELEIGPAAPIAAVPSQFVTFMTSGKTYGVDIMAVREIRSWTATTELPDGPAGAIGVLDIRGRIVEVYDLAELLGLRATQPAPGHVVVVVAYGDSDVGILAESVSDIIFVEPDDIRDPPTVGRGIDPGRISGLVRQDEQLIAILNLAALFAGSQKTWI